jgi:hypothetical protein
MEVSSQLHAPAALTPGKEPQKANILFYTFSSSRFWKVGSMIIIKLKVKLSLSFALTEQHTMKAYWGSGSIAPRILDLGTRWR